MIEFIIICIALWFPFRIMMAFYRCSQVTFLIIRRCEELAKGDQVLEMSLLNWAKDNLEVTILPEYNNKIFFSFSNLPIEMFMSDDIKNFLDYDTNN